MSYKFFQNKDCEYFPCHGIEEQNCLFCFCPLFPMGTKCGGNFIILKDGIKDCSQCVKPHIDYEWVIQRIKGYYDDERFNNKKFNNQEQITN